MTSQTNSKVRRVRCPKCWHVLPEPAEVPIYKCGGCGATLQAKKRQKDLQNEESRVEKADPEHKNELKNSSENLITDESCMDEAPTRVSSTTKDTMEWLGRENQFSGVDSISCHEFEGSSPEVGAEKEQENGNLPLDQYDTADDKESEKSASNEILLSSDLDHNDSSSVVPHSNKYECETCMSSLEKETQSRSSSSEYNSDGEKEVSDNDIENANENSVADKVTDSHQSSENNFDGHKIESENGQNTSENNSIGDVDLEKVLDNGKSSADGETEWNVRKNPNSRHEIADLSLESITHSEPVIKISFDQHDTEAPNASGNDDKEQSGDASISGEVSPSHELKHLENDSSVAGYHLYESDKSFLSSPNEVTGSAYSSPNASGNDDKEQSGDASISDEVSPSHELKHLENDSSVAGYHLYESDKSFLSSPNEVTGSAYSSPNNNDEGMTGENEDIVQVERVSTEAETYLGTVTKDQISTALNFLSEDVVLDNCMSPHRESMKQAQKGESSDDALEHMPHVYDKGNISVTLGPSTVGNYNASDGSASSNETDDQGSHRHFQLRKKDLMDVGPDSTEVLADSGEFIMDHMKSHVSEVRKELMNTKSSLQGKKHSIAKVSRWHQDEVLDCTRYRHPFASTLRNGTDDCQSRLLYSKNTSQVHHRNRGSLNHRENAFSALPDKPHELQRLVLLNMVYELQDQLKRVQIFEGVPSGRFPTRLSTRKEHYSAANRENYTDLAYNNYDERYNRDITRFPINENLRMALPDYPTQYMNRVDCSCLRCCSQEQHHSEQLPPRVIYYGEDQYLANARQTTCRPCRSASSSPQFHMTSAFSPWSHNMKSNDKWNNKHEVERIHHIAKRFFQPIAGGAPMVACYHCSKVLQLPAESLLFKTRCHRLKCGACSEVLKFSLENKVHVVRYDLVPRTPPNDIDENTRVVKKSNLASAQASNCLVPESAPSSDISRSFSRSCTGDNFSVTLPVEKVPDHRKISSTSSSKAHKEDERYKSKKGSVNKNKNSVESFEAAGPSSNMLETEHSCSESEVESPFSGSALHKLMGYSSIRRLVYQ